ncbi:hypothetical protein TWF481_000129 [Arthrobotrys musiformis]|uniref:Velvet domain-containing protein n=1 Tax=Arthrobotrys musiformis TaxID=47236 RepID=A0AAV9WM11_9PEZI
MSNIPPAPYKYVIVADQSPMGRFRDGASYVSFDCLEEPLSVQLRDILPTGKLFPIAIAACNVITQINKDENPLAESGYRYYLLGLMVVNGAERGQVSEFRMFLKLGRPGGLHTYDPSTCRCSNGTADDLSWERASGVCTPSSSTTVDQ